MENDWYCKEEHERNEFMKGVYIAYQLMGQSFGALYAGVQAKAVAMTAIHLETGFLFHDIYNYEVGKKDGISFDKFKNNVVDKLMVRVEDETNILGGK